MYKSNWPFFTNEMIDNVKNVLQSGKVNQWTGSKVFEFEKKFAEYFGTKYAIALSNGSVAIELCLKAIGIHPGDEIIVTPRTFIASASSVNICGGTPIFIDVDENSQNITLQNIQKAYTTKTKAVILVHLAGWPCQLSEIVDWCHEHNIYVIEDCAQSHGAKYNNKYAGTFGDINAWSFCQDKIITTGGEGGMVTTDNYQLYKIAWSYKDHGKNYDKVFLTPKPTTPSFRWLHDSIGTNWRMTEMQASIGIDALEHLDEWVNFRRSAAAIFNSVFSELHLVRITLPPDNIYHSYYKYYFFINPNYLKKNCTRDDIISQINNLGIPCFQGTCGEVYKEKAYSYDLQLPVTKQLTQNSIMLLVDPSYTLDTIKQISLLIKNILIDNTIIY